ncbi:antitoxin FitA [Pseudomonas sp. IT-P74]|jgi:plasmid stability protein
MISLIAGGIMASITIRNLDEKLKEQLRITAAHNGHSMEEEARLILGRALATVDRAGGLGSRIRNRFSALGGVELDLPERSEKATAVDFSE